MKSKNFKTTNNKTKVITGKNRKSKLKPNRSNSNPTIDGISTINPERSKLLIKMLFLTKFTLKSRFLRENKLGR
jgi:hypothetical protein